MQLARVVGNVVSSLKEPRLTGTKLLLVRDVGPDREPAGDPYVAVDVVGAGEGETVIVVRGTPASWALPIPESPVDAAIVGIVDRVTWAAARATAMAAEVRTPETTDRPATD